MATKPPQKLTYPYITLSNQETVPTTVDLTCFARGIHIMGEEDDASATFCDPLGYTWQITVDLLQSLGADGLDEALWSLGGPGTIVDFEFAYIKEGTVPPTGTVDNPVWSGTARLTAWPVVDAGINEPTEINLEMDVIGEITRTPDPTVAAAAA